MTSPNFDKAAPQGSAQPAGTPPPGGGTPYGEMPAPAPSYGPAPQFGALPYDGPQSGGYPPPPAGHAPYPAPAPYQPARSTAEVPNHLAWAILATLLCCMPFGIVAIVNAAQVSGRLAAGDYAGAHLASETARKWALAATICGAVAVIIYLGIVLVSMLTAGTPTSTWPAPRYNG